jgi:alpha-N-acetylglucosamine transferase
VLTIEGPDSREILLPAEMLAVDLAQVGNEEGIFVARLTHLMVNGLHALVESLTNELLWINQTMLLKSSLKKGFL